MYMSFSRFSQLEDQNEHLREQNQKCESQLELLRGRITQISTLELSSLQSSKSKDRHSTEVRFIIGRWIGWILDGRIYLSDFQLMSRAEPNYTGFNFL
jgi:hypothetical protein